MVNSENIHKLIFLLGKRKYNSLKVRIERLFKNSIEIKNILYDKIPSETTEVIGEIESLETTHSTDTAINELTFSILALREIINGDWKK